MPARFYVFASFVAASSLLGLADPASAGDGKICGKNEGGYVAEYKVDFTMSVTAQGGTGAGKYDTCTPSNQLYSATGSTITYKSFGTTSNVSCHK